MTSPQSCDHRAYTAYEQLVVDALLQAIREDLTHENQWVLMVTQRRDGVLTVSRNRAKVLVNVQVHRH